MRRSARFRFWQLAAVAVTVTAVVVFAWRADHPATRQISHLAATASGRSPGGGGGGQTPRSPGGGGGGQTPRSPAPSTGRSGASVTPAAGNSGNVSGGRTSAPARITTPAPAPTSYVASVTVSAPTGLTCTNAARTVAASVTVTVTSVDPTPSSFSGTLHWRTYYSTTSPADLSAFVGSGQATFPTGTTTLRLTATYDRLNYVPLYGFCQGVSSNQPVPGYYIISVEADPGPTNGLVPDPAGKTSTNYTQVT